MSNSVTAVLNAAIISIVSAVLTAVVVETVSTVVARGCCVTGTA